MSFWSRGGEDIDNEIEETQQLERMRVKRRRNENNRNAANALAREHQEAANERRARQNLGLDRPIYRVRRKDCPPCPPCSNRRNQPNFRIPSFMPKVNSQTSPVIPHVALPGSVGSTVTPATNRIRFPTMIPQQMQAVVQKPMNISIGNPQLDQMMTMMQQMQRNVLNTKRNVLNTKQMQRNQAEALHVQLQMLAGIQKVGEDTQVDVLEVSDRQTQQLDSITGKSFFELTWAQTPDWLRLKMKQAAGKAVYKAGALVVDQTVGRVVKGGKYVLGPIDNIINVTLFVIVAGTGVFMLYNMGPAVYGKAAITVQEGLNQLFHIVKPMVQTLQGEATTAFTTAAGHMDTLRLGYCASLPWAARTTAKFAQLCP